MGQRTIGIKKLTENAIIPTRESDDAAGYDLYAAEYGDIIIYPHYTVMIHTGLSFEFPKDTFGAIYARSGLATKKGLRPANCVGIIDADYRGEVLVPIYNDGPHKQVIQPGERIAQLILQTYQPMHFIEKEKLNETERAEGGFGSTGKK